MLVIECPHCGPRSSAEFAYRGERSIRPSTEDVTVTAWRSYLYRRHNRAGVVTEEWFHTSGCRRFLVVERNTVTNDISSVLDRGAT